MLWNDTITVFYELVGPTTVEVTDSGGPHTILGVAMQQSNVSSDTVVRCGTDVVAKNYATNFSNVEMNYQCDDDIIISKTGNDSASVILSYVPRFTGDYATSTQFGYSPTNNISTTSDVQVYGSISAGEAIIAIFLLIFLVLKIMEYLARGLSGIDLKRYSIKYNNGDVPIEKE